MSQADYGLEALSYELNLVARAARAPCRRRVDREDPGSPALRRRLDGPDQRTLSISPDVNNPALRSITFDGMRDAYADQARGLIEGGVHLLLVETIVDTLNAKAALVAIDEVFAELGARAAGDDLGRRSPTAAGARCRARRSTRSTSRSSTPGRSPSA